MIKLEFDVVTSLTLNGVESMFKLMKESDYNYQYEVLSVVEDSQKPNGYDSVTVSCNSYITAIHLVADYLDIKPTLVTPEDVELYLI